MTQPIMPTDEEWAKINAFQIPKVRINQMVLFYSGGDTTGDPKWGIVAKIEHRSIVVLQQSLDQFNRVTESCRHKDDPELQFKPNLRQKGVWAIHPYEVEQEERLKWIEERVRLLEQRLAIKDVREELPPASANAEPSTPSARKQFGKTPELTIGIAQDMVQFHTDGKKPKEIAELLGNGWKQQTVGKALAKAKEMVKAEAAKEAEKKLETIGA